MGITSNRIYRKQFIDILSKYKKVDHLERESLRVNKDLRDKYKSKLDFIE